MLPWLLCAALACVLLAVLLKLRLVQGSMDALADTLSARLSEDTNNPIFLSVRDKHARRLAARLNEELKELRRLRLAYENGDRALKETVTNVSHDLRTPLTAIRGYLELLEQKQTDAETARWLTLIDDRVRAMTALTEELLVCASAGGERELCMEPVDIGAAVERSAAGFYAALSARGITPVITLPAARVVRMLDKKAFARVLENLFSNAIKYSGGDLTVTLTEDGALTFANSAPDLNEVCVGRMFDRFFTVDTARAAGGLGLSIAKTLVTRMGGVIDASYQAGRLCITVFYSAQGASR